MSPEPQEPPAYDARMINLISFAEAVRKRPHMYFGVRHADRKLAAAVLRAAATEPFAWAPEGMPAAADVLIQSGLQFTVSDNVPVPPPGTILPAAPYWMQSLTCGPRCALRAAAALSSRAVIELTAGGRRWRQEFTRGTARSAPADQGGCGEPGSRATFELDAGYFSADTAFPRDTPELRLAGPVAGTLTITDVRP